MSCIFLRQNSMRLKSVQTMIRPVCGCGYVVLSQEHFSPNFPNKFIVSSDQRRQSSYYTFPAFTGTQYILENLHYYSMMPWWGTILASTLILRIGVSLLLTVKQERTMATMESLDPAMEEMVKILSQNVYERGKQEGKDDDEIKKEIKKEQNKYLKKNYKMNGVSRWELFIYPYVQIPIWISLSFALRNLCGYVPKDASNELALYPAAPGIDTEGALRNLCSYVPKDASNELALYPVAPGIDTEGALWFSNLTVADPFWIIPSMILLTNLLNIELNTMVKKNPSKMGTVLKQVGRGASVYLFIMATQAPTAMSIYWAASSVLRMLEHIVLKLPRVRRALKITKTPSEHERPLMNYFEITKARTDKFFKKLQGLFKNKN